MYDKKSQENIQQIKLYQQLGVKVREIKNFLEVPETKRKEILENQVGRRCT